jgi:hypothetical protein
MNRKDAKNTKENAFLFLFATFVPFASLRFSPVSSPYA